MGVSSVLAYSLLSLGVQAPGPIARMTYDLKGVKNREYRKQVYLRESAILGLSLVTGFLAQSFGVKLVERFKPVQKLVNRFGDDLLRTTLIVPAKAVTETISRLFTHARAQDLLTEQKQAKQNFPVVVSSSDEVITVPNEATKNIQQLLFKGDERMTRYTQHRLPPSTVSSQFLKANRLYVTA